MPITHPVLRAALLAAVVAGSSSAPVAWAGTPAQCTISVTDAETGTTRRCGTYFGQPPTALLTGTVTTGSVLFVWTCDIVVFPFVASTGTFEIRRARMTLEACTLRAAVLTGPATFTATAS